MKAFKEIILIAIFVLNLMFTMAYIVGDVLYSHKLLGKDYGLTILYQLCLVVVLTEVLLEKKKNDKNL